MLNSLWMCCLQILIHRSIMQLAQYYYQCIAVLLLLLLQYKVLLGLYLFSSSSEYRLEGILRLLHTSWLPPVF